MSFLKLFFAKFSKALAFLFWISPRPVGKWTGYFLGFLWFDVFRIRREVVLENIKKAFPEMEGKEAIKIGRRSLLNLGHNFIEYSYLPFLNKKNIHKVAKVSGKENLERALSHKKGVLMLTLHLGHGDLAIAALSLSGFPIALVSKTFKLQWLNDLWFGMREKLGTEFIPPRDSSFQLLKKLKSNKVVVIPLDQFTGPPIGVRTTFFGVETGTAAGLATMALRSGAKVVPAYTYRMASGVHQVEVLPEIDMTPFKGHEDASALATQHFNLILEDFVRKHPSQWMWIHRRWKRFVVN